MWTDEIAANDGALLDHAFAREDDVFCSYDLGEAGDLVACFRLDVFAFYGGFRLRRHLEIRVG